MKTQNPIDTARVTVLNVRGEIIQTVLLADYLAGHDLSEASVSLILDGEEIHVTHPNPVFNHSVRLA